LVVYHSLLSQKSTYTLSNFKLYQSRVKGENINSLTLLATDYINHFNEVHMLIDMLPSMPDCLEDIQEWIPLSYQEHFQNSGFSAKELAIEAYDHSPVAYRVPFEDTVAQMNELILNVIPQLEDKIANNEMGDLQMIVDIYTPQMIALIDQCGAIINGEKHMAAQDSIDHYFDDNEEKLEGEDLDQNAIDDLFG